MRQFIYKNDIWNEIKPRNKKDEILEYKNHIFRKYKFLIKISKIKSNSRKTLFSINHGLEGYNFAVKFEGKLNKEDSFFNYFKYAKKLNLYNFPNFYKSQTNQFYLNKNKNQQQKILICFTGGNHALNMPIPVFHSLAKDYFHGIAYFFCNEKDHYTKNYKKTIDAISKLHQKYKSNNLALLGTSSGALMPLRFIKKDLNEVKKICCSPPILEDKQIVADVLNNKFINYKHSKIFFSAASPLDRPHYKFIMDNISEEIFANNIFNLSWFRKGHDTLNTLGLMSQLEYQLKWLASN